MKRLLLVAALAAVLGAILAANWAAARARSAERQAWEVRLAVEAESTAAWKVRANSRDSELVALRVDSAVLARGLSVAHEAAAAAIATLRTLASHADTGQARTIDDAVAAIETESRACRSALTNCELRAKTEGQRADDATLHANALALLQDSTAAKWRDAERRASPGFLGLRDLWRAKRSVATVGLIVVLTYLVVHR